jgi:hypothetical protein
MPPDLATDPHSHGTIPAASPELVRDESVRALPIFPAWHEVRRYKAVIVLALATLMWFDFLQFPRLILDIDLDASWTVAIGYFLKHRFQVGVDYIFTYGPLGFFGNGAFDPDLFWFAYSWEVIAKLIFVVVFTALSRYSPNFPYRIAFLFGVMFFFIPWVFDCFYNAFLLALGVTLVKRPRPSVLIDSSAGLILALVSLMKFTLLIDSLIVVLFLTLNSKRKGWGKAIGPLSWYLFFFFLAWIVLGQSLANLPAYIQNSWEITAGYAQAMANECTWAELLLGISLLLLISLSIWVCALSNTRTFVALSTATLLQLVVLRYWKYGFTRAGLGHTSQYFTMALFVTALLPICFSGSNRWRIPRRLLICACVFIAISGLWDYHISNQDIFSWWKRIIPNAKDLCMPSRRLETMTRNRWAFVQNEGALPSIRSFVKDATVDMISQKQAVIFVNDLNYAPRPVFQSYCAYTPALMRANAAFFMSNRAPEFVIFDLEGIDEKVPSCEDSQALLTVLELYQPVLVEKSFLLLKRCAVSDAARPLLGDLRRARIKLGREMSIEGLTTPYQTLSIQITSTLWGKLRNAFYQPAKTLLHCRLADGGTRTFSLVPSMVEDECLLNPLLSDQSDVLAFYAGGQLKRVIAFSISCADPAALRDEIAVTVKGFSELVAKPVPGFKEKLERALHSEAENLAPAFGRSQAPNFMLPAGLDGHVDVINRNIVAGWAWSEKEPDRSISVDIYDGDELVDTVIADAFREGMQKSGMGNGKHGFVYRIPSRLKDGKPHSIHVRIHVDLPGPTPGVMVRPR